MPSFQKESIHQISVLSFNAFLSKEGIHQISVLSFNALTTTTTGAGNITSKGLRKNWVINLRFFHLLQEEERKLITQFHATHGK